jgi:ribonuclease HI
MAKSKTTRFISPVEGALTVFTDGSSLHHPRRGGIGIRFIYADSQGKERVLDSQELGYTSATNNQMELMAVITAMKEIQGRRFPTEMLEPASRIHIYTDSQYVTDNVNNALYSWPASQWMTKDGPPVQNAQQWKEFRRELLKLNKIKRVHIEWGKGHSADNPHNKVADKLARESAHRATRLALVEGTVRRKKSEKKTEVGSVEMRGQQMTIRIVSVDYMPVQKLSKYRYEVVSPRSRFFGNLDFAYSRDHIMRSGHTYRVRMNEDSSFPMIRKRLLEIVATSTE